MSQTVQLRRDTSTNWALANPVLAPGEMGVVLDDLSYKLGDGITAWNSLPVRELQGLFSAALLMQAVSNPSVPSAGQMKLYAHSVAGRLMPKWMGPSGLDNSVQSALYGNGMILVSPGASTALSVMGTSAPTVSGTVSHPAILSGLSLRQSTRRSIVTGSATAGNQAGLRIAISLCYRGEEINGVPIGGFFHVVRFGLSSVISGQRGFVGLSGTTSAISGTQTTLSLLNVIGVGWDSTDTNVQFVHNDSVGNATKIDLGPSFPLGVQNAIYEMVIFCAPNGDSVGYRVSRLDVPATTSGVITSSELPAKGTLLTWQMAFNNGSVAASVIVELMRMYLETDY